MPRIYKGSETTLRLLVHTCTYEGKISDLKIALFTNDPNMAVEFTDRYTIEGNIATLTVPNYAFGSMEEGVINYIAQGMIDDDTFLTQRQSNYFLKTPANYNPAPMPEEVVLGELTTMIVENGVFEYTPTDVDAWNKATIEVNVPDTNGSYDEGYNQGYVDGQNSVECPEGGSCNLGEGEIYLTASDAGFYELNASDDGYDGWSKFYVTLEESGAIKVHKASDLLDAFNNGSIDLGTYYYVGGKITDIQEVSTQYGNATYTLDNGFSVYRGKWIDNTLFGEDQIKVGAYIVVYGIIQEHNGVLGFKVNSQVIAYQECEGGEIVSCNLEDKWLTPSMGDRDDNGYVIAYPSEGFDGLSRVFIDPTTIYNEGVTAGKAEGSDLTIGTGDIFLGASERGQRFEIFPSEYDYDAFDKFIVELDNFDLGGDTNIYDALSVHQLLMDGVISYDNKYIFKGEITEIQRVRPDYGDARYTLDGSLNVYNGQTMGYDIQVGDSVIVYGTLSEYNGAPQLSAGSEIKALWREGGGNCDDAYNSGYNQGYNDGQANCGGGDGGSCNLTQLVVTENGWYEPRPEEFGYLEMKESAAFDTGVQLFDDSWLEILFNAGETDAEIPTLFGVENSGWNDSTFAARWYSGVLSVKIGNVTVDIPLGTETDEDKLHKLKVGKNYGVWFDDVEYGSVYSEEWVMPTDTIYIGAMHNNTNSENGIWRPWNGFISNVIIHGVRNGEGAEWHFIPGDFGKWGEYKCVETDEILPNLLGDGGATMRCCKQYGEPLFNGYSAVEVNVPTIDRVIGEYRYNPITVGDIAGGLRADEINIGWPGMIGEDGDWVYENQRILLKGSLKNNNHRVYTTKKVTSIENDFVFTEGREHIQNITFDDNIYYITLMDIELVQLKEMVIGEFTSRITFRYCNFPKLDKIVIKTNHSSGLEVENTTFAENGVLYVHEGFEYIDNYISKLPSGWTVEYL